jgi:peptidyl-prolyl cis-trans isomerase C
MKSSVFAILALAPLCAQPPAPVPLAPGTPGAPQVTQAPEAPPVEIKPDTVILETANGKKYTAEEVEHLILLLPAQYQGPARTQPQAAAQLLSQILFYQRLAEDAVKEQVDKRSPYQEQVELARMQILANAELMLHHNMVMVKEEDREKYFKEHPDRFQEAKVRAILVSFNPTPDKAVPGSKKLLSEPEAKAKIEDLRKQIVGGADFGKLARENSDDVSSAGKDGDFGSMKRSSPYPEPIKNAVFALKPGEMSQPVRQPTGYWLIRLEDIHSQPYGELADQITAEIKQEEFQKWQTSIQSQYTVKVDTPSYFAPKPAPAQLQQVR